LTSARAVGRYFVLGIPSRHRQTEETAFMVFHILTAHPTGENPFGWKGVAAGKTTVHANIVRSETLEASDLETTVSDRIEARLGQGVVALDFRYRRGVPERVASEGRVRFAADPEHVRVYGADELVDIVKSVPAAIDRLEQFGLSVTLPELADIFDGSEHVVNLTVQPWFLRQVYAPSGAGHMGAKKICHRGEKSAEAGKGPDVTYDPATAGAPAPSLLPHAPVTQEDLPARRLGGYVKSSSAEDDILTRPLLLVEDRDARLLIWRKPGE